MRSLTEDTTSNILADTKGGSSNDVIVVGSHLDSVPAGPGINDNGR
jgi:Zn-dependent M28 family amino/carboxypeptidase